MKNLLLSLLAFGFMPFAAQIESASQLRPVETTVQDVYQPKGKNYVHLRSKRGNEGVDPTGAADEILELPVTEIVLVFTELAPDEERKQANLERWDNLLYTYPEFFQSGTKYSNVCQCNASGDESGFKRVQGFYVYYKGGTENPSMPVAVQEEKTVSENVEKTAQPEKPADPVAEEPEVKNETKTPAAAASTEQQTPVEKKEDVQSVAVEEVAETRSEEPEEVKEVKAAPAKVAARPAPAKRGAKTAPRRAKDPKACRPACYGFGNEDIDTWIQENVVLSKKQKRKGSKLTANVTLQLSHDGEVTRAMVSGPHTDLNKQIQEAAIKMTEWKAAVRNGVAVKSQVRMLLKFDESTKALKAENVVVMPKFPPKCACVSDRELFGTD